jgi:hypothetical protein
VDEVIDIRRGGVVLVSAGRHLEGQALVVIVGRHQDEGLLDDLRTTGRERTSVACACGVK